MTSFQALQHTLKLNNKAVALYHSNDIPHAAKIYFQSLCLVKELLKCPKEGNMNHAPNKKTTLLKQECFHTATQTSRDTPMQDKLYVYQSALVLQESPSSWEQNVQNMNIYCAGILFNTAILHHQNSIKTGKSASVGRAEQLYQASVQLVAGLSTSNDTVVLIAVAASNNLAQIEFDKGLTMQANERLQFLADLLHSSVDETSRIFTADEFQGMLSNTLLANSIAASPAA
ncbi:MAG: hypothetical protein SGBAC_011115 [Bacillariaceae sp.]